MFVVYAVLVHFAFVLLLPVLLLHPKLRGGFRSRLGFHPVHWPGLERPVIWFHGASAGDLLAIQPVVHELKALCPKCSVLMTTITNSGMRLLRQGLGGVDAFGYLPYDLPWAVGKVVRAVRPDVLVLEYAEVWPALIRAAKREGARIVITNGRFDERALSRYRWFYRLIGNPLHSVDRLCMREDTEAEHALAIGADADRLRVTGNTKFDRLGPSAGPHREEQQRLAELSRRLGLEGDGPVWVAGSTHEGEEAPILHVLQQLRRSFSNLRLIIAPRYIERSRRLVSLAEHLGLPAGLRSQGPRGEPVVILDTLGELADVYALASVVFVGGSLVKRGGQNILEPAGRGKPVLFGPHMENFADSVRVLLGRGGIQLADAGQLLQTLQDLLGRPDEMAKLGELARQAVASIRGASRANAEAIVELLADGRSREAA